MINPIARQMQCVTNWQSFLPRVQRHCVTAFRVSRDRVGLAGSRLCQDSRVPQLAAQQPFSLVSTKVQQTAVLAD